MMLAWSFAARTPEEIARLLRALGKHRYLREADLRLHWAVDRALADRSTFAPRAAAFDARCRREPALELGSRDPSLWRPAPIDEVIEALTTFWTPDDAGEAAREHLLGALIAAGVATGDHAPFGSPPDDPPFPELVMLDWVLHPIDELDADRHAGALAALEESGEEIDPSAPICQEGPPIAAPELCAGAPNGVLADDFLIWSDGPYPYADYVFRGVSKSAKLLDPPVGYRDL